MKQDRTLRIIGGKWRGRKVTFPNNDQIRPTGSRIRETVFNWLMHEITGASCLDLYAGTGVLSMEALSRGARHVTMIENDTATVSEIEQNLHQLGADESSFQIKKAHTLDWLALCNQKFDVIFVDPPFANNELMTVSRLIASRNILEGYVYLESGRPIAVEQLPAQWKIHRQKSAGSVYYYLCITG